MKTLDRQFSDKELELISVLLSWHGGELADKDKNYIGSKEHKALWNLQEYFNKKYYE